MRKLSCDNEVLAEIIKRASCNADNMVLSMTLSISLDESVPEGMVYDSRGLRIGIADCAEKMERSMPRNSE